MRWALLIVVCLMILTGCAAQHNPLANTPGEDGNIAGFWRGLWQGLICPFAFVVSLFTDSVHIYEVHNNGGWYNFGFLIGAGVVLGGSSKATD